MADSEKTVKVILEGDSKSLQKATKDGAGGVKDLQQAFGVFGKEASKSIDDLADRTGLLGGVLKSMGPAGIGAAAGVGAITIAAGLATKAIGDLVDKAGKLADLSTKTSLSTDFLQDLDFVASQVGVSLEDAAGAAGKLQKTLGDAKSGNIEAVKAFEAIGISIDDIRDKKFEDVLAQTFQALGNVKDESQQVALGTDLMGKSFQASANLVRTDLVTAFEQARQSGTKLSEDQIKAADDLGDALTRLGKTAEALKLTIGSELLGAIGGGDAAQGVDTITEAVKGLIALVKDPQFQTFLNVLTGGAGGGVLGALKFGVSKLAQNAPATVLSDEQIAKKTAVTGPDLFTELSGDQGLVARAKARAEEQKKAQTEAEAYARALERVNEEERKGFVEGQKRWAAEQKAVEKVNDAVKQRLGAAQFSIFGTSPQAADEAVQKFDDLAIALGAQIEFLGEGKVAYNGLSEAILNLSDDALTKYEQQLMAAEKATRGNAEANEVIRKTLREVQAEIDKRDMAEGFEEARVEAEKLVDKTREVADALGLAANAAHDLGLEGLGNFLGGLSRALDLASNLKQEMAATGKLSTGSKIEAAQAAIGIGVDAFRGATTKTKTSAAKGALTGAAKGAIIGSAVPVIGTAAGAIIGGIIGGVAGFLGSKKKIKQALAEMTQQLTQQFGSLDKARQAAKKYGIDLDKALSSKKPEQLKKAMEDLAKATQKEADKLAGLQAAQDSVTQLQDAVADSTNEKLKAAVQQLASKVSDELFKAGGGFFATGALRSSEAFQGAQGISQAAAGTVAGLRQAGVVDQGVLEAAGTIATEAQKQAFEAAKAAGLSDAEAQKASFGAISEILKEQLNASLASGKELDANTRALIEEAKKNGIDILADPAIEAVAVAKDQLDVLKQIASGARGAGQNAKERIAQGVPQFAGGSGGFLNFGSGTLAELHGVEGVFRPQDIMADIPRLGDMIPTFASRDLGSADSSILPVSMPAVNITVNGNPSREDRNALEKSVARAIRLGQSDLMAALDVWAGRKGRR